MLQHLIIHFSLHYLSSRLDYWPLSGKGARSFLGTTRESGGNRAYLSSGPLQKVKNTGKFQIFSSKSGDSRLREVVAYNRFEIG